MASKHPSNAPPANGGAVEEDEMPSLIDFSGGVRGKYSPARREAARLRRALEKIRDKTGVEEHPLAAARDMQAAARQALETTPLDHASVSHGFAPPASAPATLSRS